MSIPGNKKHNPYDKAQVMLKYNLSESDAIEKIAILKKKTSGSLENFVSRYGEVEGHLKYDAFCQKSANTEDKFIKKYGEDEGKKKWNDYIKSKDSRSLSGMIARYGDEGRQMYDDTIQRYKFSMSEEGFIEKYGKETGKEKFTEMNLKKNVNTLSHYIEKHGETLGPLKFNEANFQRGFKNTLDGYIEKHGAVIGEQLYLDKNKRSSPIYNKLKSLYDEAITEQKYADYLQNKLDADVIAISKELSINDARKSKKSYGSVSKASVAFFAELEKQLQRKLQYGSKINELELFDGINCKIYRYDCFDENTNTIIEFNGSSFHTDGSDDSWIHQFGYSAEEIKHRDKQKIDFAVSCGYKVLVVWDYETDTKTKTVRKINELKEVL
jgi:primosomal protein N''